MIVCEPYQVIVIPENARESVEQMGSKEKFWFTESALGWSLYKVARSETGEDWSEKIAEQFAGLLGLPHARYELAEWHDPDDGLDTRGVVTPTLVPKGGRLISGNELLVAQVQGYPMAWATYFSIPGSEIQIDTMKTGHSSKRKPEGPTVLRLGI